MSNFTKVWMATALLLLSHLLSAQTTDPWAIKKQRKNTGQYPTVPYQTRSGQNIQKPNNARRGPLLQLPQSASPSVASLTVQQGPADEPPHEIKGALPASANARRSTDLLGAAQHYLGEVSSLMQVKAPTEEFGVERQWKDAQGKQHLRMQQQYRGVKVYGSEIIVHADAANTVQGLNGRYIASPHTLNPVPSVSETRAVDASLDYFRRQGALESLTAEQQRILDYTAPTAELIILPTWETPTPTLAWRVIVRPNFLDHWEVFVDAHSGELISQTNMTCTFAPEIDFSKEDHTEAHHHSHAPAAATPYALLSPGQGSGVDLNGVNRSLGIWQVGNESALIDASKDMFKSNNSTPFNELEGVLITFDAQRAVDAEQFYYIGRVGTTFDDPTAVSAHYNASVAYDYFRDKHGRLSIDGEGGNVISIINVVDKDEAGNAVEMDNAYWNGAYMAYGNGNVGFKPLAGGLDVGGHEMSHGVIGSTAGLVYRNQSGAINEHFADVYGVIIDEENYTLGETIVLPGVFPSGAMRDMEDPHNGGNELGDQGWQPNHMDEFYSGTADNGGVHINSGIPNRAFYLIAAEFGRDKTGAIYYDALTKYLTASSQFIDLRRAIINSARDLYGDAEVQVVAQAFDAVGITDGNTPDGGGGGDPDPLPDPEEENDNLPAIAGENLTLIVNTDPDDNDGVNPWSLIVDYKDKDNDFRRISTTSVLRKPSVTDDGSFALFITDENNINIIGLTEPFEEAIIDTSGVWGNISISRDGSRMAIVTNQDTPEIYVGDLTTNEFMRYELYNPTSQDGIVTRDVQYADAIEWDYSGEYLLYDAFNQVQTLGANQQENDAIEYWDVNFIKVWDNTKNTFGSGEIIKVFSNLPKGISIGNPTFSKTNRNIAAFDLFNAEENTYAIIAADLETGETKTVYENNTVGFPSYSNDDRFMVFDVIDEDGRPAVRQIALKSNKLEAAEASTPLYWEAQWTTWFGQGTRVINSPENNLLSFEIKQGEFTAPGTIEGRMIALDVPGTVDVTKLVAKFEQSSGASVYVDDARQYSSLTSNDFSKEVIYSVIAENGDQQDYTVRVTQDGTPPQPGDPDPDGPDLPGKPDTGGNNPDEVVSTEEEVIQSPLVYPNPFEQDLYLGESLSGQAVELTLHNILGQAIPLKKQGDHFQLTGPVRPGLYMLTIRRGSDTQTVRLMKR